MTQPELHRPFDVTSIGRAGADVEVKATAAECTRLAVRMGLPALYELVCRFHLSAMPGGIVLAAGHLQARPVQVCVISLEEFEAVVDERFTARFVPEHEIGDEIDPETDDEIPYTGNTIDLGEAAAEQFALSLDQFPRAPGAELPPSDPAQTDHPFGTLAQFKPRK